MRHEELLSAERCLLLVVDMQDAFAGHISNMEQLIDRTRLMIEASRFLEVPIMVSEQYPQGLGHTVEPLRDVLGDCKYFEKTAFSCCQDKAIRQALAAGDRPQVLMVGIETHVCILQTALDLLAMGLQPYVGVDAVGSRRETDKEVALQRMRQAGAITTTTEAAIFEMMVSSEHRAFRQITKLVK
jgi:nicotinamidase-related amidase